MALAYLLEEKDIEALKVLADKAPEIIAALKTKVEAAVMPQISAWKTLDEISQELQCSKSHIIKMRDTDIFPYECVRISEGTVRYRLKPNTVPSSFMKRK